MKRFKSIALAVCAILIGVSYLVPPASVSAASASLSIVPKKNYTIQPGKSVNDTLIIRNLDAEQSLKLTLRVVDFTFNDDGGTPKLMLDPQAPQTTWSLKPFLTVPESVEIPPKSTRTLNTSVKIPSNQGAGSYYSAIVYSSGAAEGGNVGLSASGVTLVFTSIPGKVKEDLKLDKFGAYHDAKDGKPAGYSYFNKNKPELIGYTLKNNGNVTEAPVGTITLKYMFGKETTIDDVNPTSSLALIGQTRTYTACIKLEKENVEFGGTRSQTKKCAPPSLWPGYYGASIDLFYGQNGNKTQEIVSSGGFWYLPLWFVFTFLVVLVIVSFFIWKTVRSVRAKLYGPKVKKLKRRR